MNGDERYLHDAMFHGLVDAMVHGVITGMASMKDFRDAAELAERICLERRLGMKRPTCDSAD